MRQPTGGLVSRYVNRNGIEERALSVRGSANSPARPRVAERTQLRGERPLGDFLRQYHYGGLDVIGPDGYPVEWHTEIKYGIRDRDGCRCLRCGHPYTPESNTMEECVLPGGAKTMNSWSPCDAGCTHQGPIRFRDRARTDVWTEVDLDVIGVTAAEAQIDDAAELVGMSRSRYEVQALWRVLTVHHLDGDKLNCRWWNLVSLCQRCHLNVQRRVVMNRVYVFEHSEWFKPFAAGWYAFAYLGEDLTREHVDARLEELLALERLV